MPNPLFIILSIPRNLPTEAPVPAPKLPSSASISPAFLQASYPIALSGLHLGSPTTRSNSDAPQTIGTTPTPTSNPTPFSSKYSIAPDPASRPYALPPLSITAWICSTRLTGLRSSVSLDAGPPPLTSTPAQAPFSHIITAVSYTHLTLPTNREV